MAKVPNLYSIQLADHTFYDRKFTKSYHQFFPVNRIILHSKAVDSLSPTAFKLFFMLQSHAYLMRSSCVELDLNMLIKCREPVEIVLTQLQQYQLLTFTKIKQNKENKIKERPLEKITSGDAQVLPVSDKISKPVKKRSMPTKLARYSNQIESLYAEHYPLKKGKSKGVEKLEKEIKTPEDLEKLKTSILAYSKTITDPKYTKHFSTFASEWRDWLDPDAGKASIASVAVRPLVEW